MGGKKEVEEMAVSIVEFLKITIRTNLLNWCNLVSISKNIVFYAFLLVRIYYIFSKFVNIY